VYLYSPKRDQNIERDGHMPTLAGAVDEKKQWKDLPCGCMDGTAEMPQNQRADDWVLVSA